MSITMTPEAYSAYENMDPGIRAVVKMLNEEGFHTTDSGDGVSKDPDEMAGISPFPHVVMTVDPYHMRAEADRLYEILTEKFGFDPDATVFDPELEQERSLWQVEATYFPGGTTPSVIMLTGVNDQMLLDALKKIAGE